MRVKRAERDPGRTSVRLTPDEILAGRLRLALDTLEQALRTPMPGSVRPQVQHAAVALRDAMTLFEALKGQPSGDAA